MSTIQIRIDEKTKKEAVKIFDDLGIDMSTAIKVYLKKVIVTQGIPFQIITENGLTIEQELDILKASKDAAKGIDVTEAMSADKAVEYLKSIAKKKKK